MRHFRFRHLVIALAMSSTLACFGGSCSDEGGGFITNPKIGSYKPCKAAIGEDVVITGQSFFATQGMGYVRINGVNCPIKSWSNSKIKFTVPAGATSGPITVSNNDAVSDVGETFEVGARTPVAEVEPNDNIDGSNATDTGMDQGGSGNLASVADRDHFKINCIHPGDAYELRLTPRLVGTVYINGVAKTLDVNGKLVISGFDYPSGSFVVGLTGATGGYTLTVN